MLAENKFQFYDFYVGLMLKMKRWKYIFKCES